MQTNITNLDLQKKALVGKHFSLNKDDEIILNQEEINSIISTETIEKVLEEKITTDGNFVSKQKATEEVSFIVSQSRINQIISKLKVYPSFKINHQPIDFIDEIEKDFYLLKNQEFQNALLIFNFPEQLRKLISLISINGSAVALFRKSFNSENQKLNKSHGLSISNDYLYIYDDFEKLSYLFVTYKRKSGIETELITEEYNIANNFYEVTTYDTFGHFVKNKVEINEENSTVDAQIPAIIFNNAFNNFQSDLTILSDEIKNYADLKTVVNRNIDFSVPFVTNESTGDFTKFDEQLEGIKNKKISGYDNSHSSFFNDGLTESTSFKYNSPNLTATADSLILKDRIIKSILAKINYMGDVLLDKSSQVNEDLIEYADKNVLESYIQGFDYLRDKFKSLYQLLANQILNGLEIEVHFVLQTYSKKIASRQQAMSEVSQGLRTLENFIINFGEGSIDEKINELHKLLIQKKQQEAIEMKNNMVLNENGNSNDLIRGSDNKNPLESEI